MPVVLACPSCDARLKLPDTAAGTGKKLKCPKCGTAIDTGASHHPPAAPPAQSDTHDTGGGMTVDTTVKRPPAKKADSANGINPTKEGSPAKPPSKGSAKKADKDAHTDGEAKEDKTADSKAKAKKRRPSDEDEEEDDEPRKNYGRIRANDLRRTCRGLNIVYWGHCGLLGGIAMLLLSLILAGLVAKIVEMSNPLPMDPENMSEKERYEKLQQEQERQEAARAGKVVRNEPEKSRTEVAIEVRGKINFARTLTMWLVGVPGFLLLLAGTVGLFAGLGFCWGAPPHHGGRTLAIVSIVALGLALPTLLLFLISPYAGLVSVLFALVGGYAFAYFLRAIMLTMKAPGTPKNIMIMIVTSMVLIVIGSVLYAVASRYGPSGNSVPTGSALTRPEGLDPAELLASANPFLDIVKLVLVIVGLGLYCWFLTNLVNAIGELRLKLTEGKAEERSSVWVFLMLVDGIFIFIIAVMVIAHNYGDQLLDNKFKESSLRQPATLALAETWAHHPHERF